MKGGRSSTSPRAAALLLVVLPLAGCASGPDDGGAAPATTSAAPVSSPAGAGDLVVDLDRGDGSGPERYTVTCTDPVAGDLPDAAGACAHLEQLDAPFAALPADQVCTEQYGGPQTALVTGRWAGADVRLQLARTNGCQISQWDSLGPLLPGRVG